MKVPEIKISKKPFYIKLSEGIDCFELFKKIENTFDRCFLLESLGTEGHMSRYCLIGFDPERLISAKGKELIIDGKRFKVENPYFALRDMVPQSAFSRNYAGGLVGYLGYDAAVYFEKKLRIKTHPKFESFLFGVFTDGIVYDKLTGELFYFYFNRNRLSEVRRLLNFKAANKKFAIKIKSDSPTKREYFALVKQVKSEILKGNTFQCEIGIKTEFEIQGNPIAVYEKLRNINPSPFMYYLKFGEKKIIGASPELLLGIRNREITTFPLAGTIKRGANELEDQLLARKLLNDPKEIAEHSMLVDLHRNDIGRVSRFGSVKVRNLMNIKRFSHVQHISSEIVGLLKSGEDMFSSIAANFPAGTLTGAPKIESMNIIERLEKQPRGPYGGAIGQFGFNGDCTFAIPIRTIFISGNYGFTQAASGIVYDSAAENEYNEIQRKLAVMKEVLFN